MATSKPLDTLALAHLAAALAHEVRNPLNSIAIHADLLASRLRKAGMADPAVLERSIASLGREVERIDRILGTYLDCVGPRELERQVLVVGEVVRAALERARPQAKAREVRLQSRTTPAEARWTFDEAALCRVLDLLIDNALDASSAGGTVTVRATVRGERGAIEVIDEGEGISSEALPQLFLLGYTTREGRSGVGLTVVKQIVRGHGGSITAQSDGPGKGATFRIELPLLVPDASDAG
jgi:two-component system, sporulation sensor kinase E